MGQHHQLTQMLKAGALGLYCGGVSFTALGQEVSQTLSQTDGEVILAKQYIETRNTKDDLQWTSESITIIEKSEIESSYRKDLSDISGYVPGMVIDPLANTPQGAAISIRGIQSDKSNSGLEPVVAVSVDGVYIGTHAGQNQVLFDFERIEIARGPQGTFSGAPAEAGSINIVRTKPTGELGLVTKVSVGDFETRQVEAVLNFPITENLAGKVTARLAESENFGISSLNETRSENKIRESALSFSMLWQANDNLQAQYTVDFERDDSDTPALVNLSTESDLVCVPRPLADADFMANCGNEGLAGGGRTGETTTNRTLQNFSNDRRYDGLHHTIRLDSTWNNLDVTSITGFRSTEELSNLDLDGTFSDAYSSIIEKDYDQFSTEVKVNGRMNEATNFSLGAFWMDSRYKINRNDLFVLDTLATAGRIPNSSSDQTIVASSRQDNSIRSLFAYANHQIDDLWKADIGGRVSAYTKAYDREIAFGDTTTSFDDDDKWTEFSANTSLSYNVPEEDAMMYLRLGIAYTPGGFFNRALSLETAPYRNSQETQSIELGMKSEWLDKRLRLNMAFYQNYQDEKVEEYAGLTSNNNIEAMLGNVAEIEVRGFDLEFEYAVFDNFHIRGAFSHMNAIYERYDIPDIAKRLEVPIADDPDSGPDPTALLSLASLEPNRAPDDTYFVSAKYSFPYRHGIVSLYAGYSRVATYQTNPLIDVAKVRLHSKWDASIDYQMKNFTIRLFGQNLINDRYLLNYENSFDAQIASISGQTAIQGISTTAERNRPQYIGIDFIWKPSLDFLNY